jgi:ribosomal protein S18 acetylase RimI-like enzyme
VSLPGGYALRAAGRGDIPQITELNAAAHGENERHASQVLLDAPAPPFPVPADERPTTTGVDDWTVVCLGDEVVSTCALFAHHLRVADVVLPVGQVEYVATAEAHRRKGLIRAQMDELHRRSEARGDLLTLITGIPHYYRRFGYGYALDWPERLTVPLHMEAPDDVTVRPATADDLEALVALHERPLARAGVALQRGRRSWWWLVTEGPDWNDHVLVAEVGGAVVGTVRYLQWSGEPTAEVMDGAADTIEVGRALLAGVRARLGASAVCSFDRPGDPFSAALHSVGLPTARWHPTYVRIPDPVAILRALQPVLTRRLAASPFAHERGSLVISFYTSGVRLDYAAGEVTAVEPDPGIEDPDDSDDTGIAPDAFPALVLGRFGASGLERRVDDVLLGRDRDLMDVLFPRMMNDHTFPI